MQSKNKLIVFVDGPTGAGKDYLIEDMTHVVRTNYGWVTEHAILADMVLANGLDSEKRKYTHYDSDDQSKIDKISRAHHLALEELKEKAKQCDILLVNRSYLSFLVYNLQDKDSELAYIEEYKSSLKSLSKEGIKTALIKVIPNNPLKTILQRIRGRNDGKAIDEGWILRMVNNYCKFRPELEECYDVYREVDSDYSIYLLNNVLEPLRLSEL